MRPVWRYSKQADDSRAAMRKPPRCDFLPHAQKPWGAATLTLLILLVSGLVMSCGAPDATATPAHAPASETGYALATEPGRRNTQGPATAASVTPSATATAPAPLAAVVNGEYIFLADLERLMLPYEQILLDQGLDSDSDEGQAQLSKIKGDVLESLIDNALVRQEAAALDLTLSDSEVEAQLVSDIAEGGGQAAFEEWLKATGQTGDDYKEMLFQAMLSQRVLEAVTANVPPEVEQVHARHIVVDSYEAAQQMLSSLHEGADFSAVAKEQSLDFATKDSGGDLGWFPRGLMAPELDDAAFALQPGEISDIIPLGEGFHILQVLERDAARPVPADMEVDYELSVFYNWLAERRAAATIERYVGP